MSVVSIETCRALLLHDTPTPAAYQTQIEGIPELSKVTLEIFKNLLQKNTGDTFEKTTIERQITAIAPLKELFSELKGKLEVAQKVPSGFKLTCICIVGFLGLTFLSCVTNNSRLIQIIGWAGFVFLGHSLNWTTDDYQIKTQLHLFKHNHAKYTSETVLKKFQEFFLDNKKMENIESQIVRIIDHAPKDSIQRKTHEIALEQLRNCRNFCTVFAE